MLSLGGQTLKKKKKIVNLIIILKSCNYCFHRRRLAPPSRKIYFKWTSSLISSLKLTIGFLIDIYISGNSLTLYVQKSIYLV